MRQWFRDKGWGVKKFFAWGEGWKRAKKNEFHEEEIPDLQKPFTEDQFRAYAKQYGIQCAREFLNCCDYMKPRYAWNIMHPDPHAPTPEEIAEFNRIFETNLHQFSCSLAWMFGIWGFDIIRFEQYLAEKFQYDPKADQSIAEFIRLRWGEAAENLVKNLLNRKRNEAEKISLPH